MALKCPRSRGFINIAYVVVIITPRRRVVAGGGNSRLSTFLTWGDVPETLHPRSVPD